MTAPTETAAAATVLICSRDRAQMLSDTVESILAGTVLPGELLVVDQSSAHNRELAGMGDVRGCRIRYLQSETTGLSRARNVGLRASANDIVVLLDDDMFVEVDWLEQLLSGLPDDPASLATGRVLAAPDEGLGGSVAAAALVQRDEPAVYRGPQPIDVVPGANVALRRDIVLSLGGYDERLGAGTRFAAADDNDMGHRLLREGCAVHHVPSAVVLHRAWRAPGERVRLRWRYGRGKGAFYAKHAGFRDPQLLRRALIDVGRRLRRAVASVVRAPRTTAAELTSVGGMLAGAVDWIARERIPGAFRTTTE